MGSALGKSDEENVHVGGCLYGEMSTAGPFSPGFPSSPPNRDMDPYRHSAGYSDMNSNGRQHALPHHKDLVAKAKARVLGLDPNTGVSVAVDKKPCRMMVNGEQQMGTLLKTAESSAGLFDSFLSQRRPDLAYVEFLVFVEILVERIPRHKDYPVLAGDRGNLHRLYNDLMKVW